MENTRIQLHPCNDAVALVDVGAGLATKRAYGDQEGALGPAAVEDEGAAAEHVEEDHGHHRRDHRGCVVDDLSLTISDETDLTWVRRDYGVDEGLVCQAHRSVECRAVGA